MDEPMDYASAGVDIDLEGSAVASPFHPWDVGSPGRHSRAPVDLPWIWWIDRIWR